MKTIKLTEIEAKYIIEVLRQVKEEPLFGLDLDAQEAIDILEAAARYG